MKKVRRLALLAPVLLCLSCAGPSGTAPDLPEGASFTFTGRLQLGESLLPVQGAVKNDRGTLKMALMVQQGIQLAHGFFDPVYGGWRATFSHAPVFASVFQETAQCLSEILPRLFRAGEAERANLPAGWTHSPEGGALCFHGPGKDLTLPLEQFR